MACGVPSRARWPAFGPRASFHHEGNSGTGFSSAHGSGAGAASNSSSARATFLSSPPEPARPERRGRSPLPRARESGRRRRVLRSCPGLLFPAKTAPLQAALRRAAARPRADPLAAAAGQFKQFPQKRGRRRLAFLHQVQGMELLFETGLTERGQHRRRMAPGAPAQPGQALPDRLQFRAEPPPRRRAPAGRPPAPANRADAPPLPASPRSGRPSGRDRAGSGAARCGASVAWLRSTEPGASPASGSPKARLMRNRSGREAAS